MSIGRNGIKNLAFLNDDELNDDLIKNFENNNNNILMKSKDNYSINSLDISSNKKNDLESSDSNLNVSSLANGKKLTTKGYILILALSSTVFASCSAYSLVAPFLPRVAESKGLSIERYSIIFAVYEIVGFLMPPIGAKLAMRMTPKIFLITALIVFSFCSVIFGFLEYAKDGDTFFYCCIIVRIIWSTGGASCTTATYLCGTLLFPDHVSTIYAAIEVGAGAGFMCGPFVGGWLFETGGFPLPFLATAFLCLLTIIPICFLIQNEVKPKKEDNEKPTTYLQLFSVPGVSINLLISAATCCCIGFNESTLDHHLREINPEMTPSQVGRIFLITGMIYSVFTFVYGEIAKKYAKWCYYLIFIGLILLMCSFAIVGPNPYLPLNARIEYVIISQCCFGTGMGALFVLSFDDCVKEAKKYLPNSDSTMAGISGLYTSSYALGTAIGPFIGGQLISRYGYRTATMPILGIAITLTLIVIVYVFKIKKDVKEIENNGISTISKILS